MAWVRASKPVAAVISRGMETVRRGSTRAILGMIIGLAISILTSRSVSVMMVNWVTSLPVPAVVGTAITGAPGLGILFAPMNSVILRPGLVASAPMALAVSIGLPPPTAIRKSAPASL